MAAFEAGLYFGVNYGLFFYLHPQNFFLRYWTGRIRTNGSSFTAGFWKIKSNNSNFQAYFSNKINLFFLYSIGVAWAITGMSRWLVYPLVSIRYRMTTAYTSQLNEGKYLTLIFVDLFCWNFSNRKDRASKKHS